MGIEDSGELSKIFSKRIFKGGGVAAVCAPVYLNDGASKAELARIVEAADGNAFILDMEYLGEHISNKTRGIFLKCALCALAVVGIFLAVSLRSAAMAACAMACVCAGLVWCFALMRVCGVPITLTNFIFVIFSVCLAQDYAVMIMWAAVREKKGVSAAGPVLLSALTTTAAFGALAFARHPVISGLGAAAGISHIFDIVRVGIGGACLRKNPWRGIRWQIKKWLGAESPTADIGGLSRFISLLKIGLGPAYGLLVFVAAFFILFRRRAVAPICAVSFENFWLPGADYFYCARISSVFSFGVSILDRTASFSGCGSIKVRDCAESIIRESAKEGRGTLVLASHTGGWAIAAGKLAENFPEAAILGADRERLEIRKLV